MALSRARGPRYDAPEMGRIVNITTTSHDDPRGLADLWPVEGALEAFPAIMAKDLAGAV